jgi:hypothetical protein
MKWLLVTTNPAPHVPGTDHPHGAGWNVGDVFARIGTEQVIREVDPQAEFDLLNMDSHASIMTERPFDRCVLAGRPAFWKGCETHPLWTHVINGWPGRDPRKIAALGVGACYSLPRDDAHVHARLADLKSKVWGTSLRFAFDTDAARLGVCPASWVLLDRPGKATRKLCNFMPSGGHYKELAPFEFEAWHAMAGLAAHCLRERGFDFIAHTAIERKWSRMLGWPADRIIYAETVEPYLEAYASASHYFGNRMHGAVILAGRNANALAVGYDSRLRMVSRVACDACMPSELSLRDVINFAESEAGVYEGRVRMIRGERAKAVRMMREFAK